MDVSISHDPFAPELQYVLIIHGDDGALSNAYGPGSEFDLNGLAEQQHAEFTVLPLEAVSTFPVPEPEPEVAEPQPEAIVPSGEPQAEAPADPAAEAAPATAPEAPAPEGDVSAAPAVPVGTEPQSEPVPEAVEVPGVVEQMEGQPGPAENAETGEVTQPGEPLPPIPPEASPADATPTEGTVQ